MSWTEIRDDVGLADYYCLLAEALDAEEIEDLDRYNLEVSFATAFHAPKKLKKFQWSSIDKAGTVPLRSNKQSVAEGMVGMVRAFGGFKGNQITINGSLEEYAKIKNKIVIYHDGKGGFVDKDGNPVERSENTLVSATGGIVH